MKKEIIRRASECHSELDPDLHPLLRKIYSARGVKSAHELERSLSGLLPWQSLKGIHAAVHLLADALKSEKKILIVGDFDADGATGTAVAVRALKMLGAKHVGYLVPNRFSYGYGLTPGLVEEAKSLIPDVIVTVDNGIASHEGVLAAKAAGMQVVITDHHLPAGTLPEADAIVNPNQPDDAFPSKNIAGVGVIFYVMLALRSYLRDENYFQKCGFSEPKLSQLLDLVALGTVADVVPLDHNNRILVHQGLNRIRRGQCIPGISALLQAGGRTHERLQASDLGFVVAPRLNAAGRLDDMSLGIECLLSDVTEVASGMAVILNDLNLERRAIEQDMQQQALVAIEKLRGLDEQKLPLGLCLFEPDWHQGVIGIVAGRIKDRLHRPVIAFARADKNSLKGSARSVQGLHIRDILADISAKSPGLIEKFGGHAMAAGLSLAEEAFRSFAALFDQAVRDRVDERDLQSVIVSDGSLAPADHTLAVADMLRAGGPWGQAFPEPLFDGTFDLLEQRIVGMKHLKMTLGCEGQVIPAIAFNIDARMWPNHRCNKIHAAYRMDVNEYRGKSSVQLMVEYLEPV